MQKALARRVARVAGTKASAYKGVTWSKAKQKWQARISVRNKHRHLGLFNDELEAAAAYDAAAAEKASTGIC